MRQVGLNPKLFADQVQGLRIVVGRSSSFDLVQQTGEPLTGGSARFGRPGDRRGDDLTSY